MYGEPHGAHKGRGEGYLHDIPPCLLGFNLNACYIWVSVFSKIKHGVVGAPMCTTSGYIGLHRAASQASICSPTLHTARPSPHLCFEDSPTRTRFSWIRTLSYDPDLFSSGVAMAWLCDNHDDNKDLFMTFSLVLDVLSWSDLSQGKSLSLGIKWS